MDKVSVQLVYGNCGGGSSRFELRFLKYSHHRDRSSAILGPPKKKPLLGLRSRTLCADPQCQSCFFIPSISVSPFGSVRFFDSLIWKMDSILIVSVMHVECELLLCELILVFFFFFEILNFGLNFGGLLKILGGRSFESEKMENTSRKEEKVFVKFHIIFFCNFFS